MKWISIAEILPEAGTDVLVYTDEGVTEARFDYSEDGDFYFAVLWMAVHGCGCCGVEGSEVTHWMSLPEPPTKSEEK